MPFLLDDRMISTVQETGVSRHNGDECSRGVYNSSKMGVGEARSWKLSIFCAVYLKNFSTNMNQKKGGGVGTDPIAFPFPPPYMEYRTPVKPLDAIVLCDNRRVFRTLSSGPKWPNDVVGHWVIFQLGHAVDIHQCGTHNYRLCDLWTKKRASTRFPGIR